MKDSRPFDVLEDIASRSIPDDANVIPRLAARLGKPRLATTIRSRPLLAIVIAVLILFVITGAAYALGRSLGYIPGVGLVNTDAPLRTLAAPVSLARDGITVTVEGATLSSDKTVIRFRVEGGPVAAAPQDISRCDAQWGGLVLPDGSLLRSLEGFGLNGTDTGYVARFTFGPVPALMTTATFIPPCISNYLPGAAAADWGMKLRFTAAPAGLVAAPVVQLNPNAGSADPMVVDKVIETDAAYVVIGEFHEVDMPPGQKAVIFPTWLKITDANGNDVPYTLPNVDLGLPSEPAGPGSFAWAFQTEGKTFAWPLTIKSESLRVEHEDARAQFEFDAGPNSQDGQVWENLHIDLKLAGYPVRVVSALRTANSYQFTFESLSSAVFGGVQLQIGDSKPGLTGMDGLSTFSSEAKFDGPVPSGKLTVVVTRPLIDMLGTWQVKWQPERAAQGVASPTPAPQACLTLDTWKAALSNPAPIPPGLNTRVLVSGRIVQDGKPASEQNTGIYFTRLDGSDRQQILPGYNWAGPSVSPDGTQVVYDSTGYQGGEGLRILDLGTGSTRPIPNTSADDMVPFWSPDGIRIVFLRLSEHALYVVGPDGLGLRKLMSLGDSEQPVGWWPDGSAFIYSTPALEGALLKKISLGSGRVSEMFVAAADLGAAVSPDGNRIAFERREPATAVSLYVSGLDGSDRRLLAELGDYRGILNPRWTADSRWLLVNILDDPNKDNADAAMALINPQTCEFIPLSITGTIRAWLP